MNSLSLKREKKVIAVDFQNFKLHRLAEEYVRIYTQFGVETASIWSMDKLTNKIEKKQFNNFVKEEMRKYGFRVLKGGGNTLNN